MKVEIFSVFDAAASSFMAPFTAPTEAVALRALVELPVQNPQHTFVRFSEQYTLFRLGELDLGDGMIHPCAPEAIGNLKVIFSRVKVAPSVHALTERIEGADPDLVMERAS